MSIKIDKDVPIPPRQRKGGHPPKPDSMTGFVKNMEIGDSFFLPNRDSGQIGGTKKHWMDATGFKFEARNAEEDNIPGVRIWRTE